MREGANVHVTEKEEPEVQEGFSRADAGRDGRFRNSPLEYRREEGTDARGLESKAGGQGNPGTQAQGWWGSPQH